MHSTFKIPNISIILQIESHLSSPWGNENWTGLLSLLDYNREDEHKLSAGLTWEKKSALTHASKLHQNENCLMKSCMYVSKHWSASFMHPVLLQNCCKARKIRISLVKCALWNKFSPNLFRAPACITIDMHHCICWSMPYFCPKAC